MVAVLMKRGYPSAAEAEASGSSSLTAAIRHHHSDPDPERDFPTLTHVIMLKDTWAGVVEQMHELGLTAVVRLFKINYNLRRVPSQFLKSFDLAQTLFTLDADSTVLPTCATTRKRTPISGCLGAHRRHRDPRQGIDKRSQKLK
jgi:hypothetical protein